VRALAHALPFVPGHRAGFFRLSRFFRLCPLRQPLRPLVALLTQHWYNGKCSNAPLRLNLVDRQKVSRFPALPCFSPFCRRLQKGLNPFSRSSCRHRQNDRIPCCCLN
jgi:hypothetical protein